MLTFPWHEIVNDGRKHDHRQNNKEKADCEKGGNRNEDR
jgi:hypothetical protein